MDHQERIMKADAELSEEMALLRIGVDRATAAIIRFNRAILACGAQFYFEQDGQRCAEGGVTCNRL